MTNRIDAKFASLKAKKKSAFIAFITAGDPEPEITVPAMHALVTGGADILELGVPFSDPGADGTSIQGSNERALKHNVGIVDVLAMVKKFRLKDQATPIVLMGYLNPIENLGVAVFAASAGEAGVDALITVDLPPEESADFDSVILDKGIYPVYLLAPTSTDERVKVISSRCKGFVYYVSIKGVTGSKEPDYKEVNAQVSRIRQFTDLPIAVGFGIKDRMAVEKIRAIADGAVVGSAIVNIMANSQNHADIPEAVEKFVHSLTKN